jgi:membrane-bound lytic murein transglycosylase D
MRHISLFMFFVYGCLFAQAQHTKHPIFYADEHVLNQIDSSTIALKSKLFAKTLHTNDKKTIRHLEQEIPIFDDSIYIHRLSILESAIPLCFNTSVRSYIDRYTIKNRVLIARMLSWSKYYFPIFEQALDRANLPLELKYMAVIESALNPNAVSRAGATGMWQFMPETGRMYGLKVGQLYDERRDIIKSTEAAISYLQHSYDVYGDWLLVIASYNCGIGNVNKAIKRAGGSRNFWDIKDFLPAETRGYVPAFIAAFYAMQYASEHNIHPSIDVEFELFTDTINIDSRFNLNLLLTELEIDLETFKNLNPSLRSGQIPFIPGGITLTLPYTKTQLLSAIVTDTSYKRNHDLTIAKKLGKLPSNKESTGQYYLVKKGDNLSGISKKYGVTVNEILKWNNLSNTKLVIGKKLIIFPNHG